MQEKGLPQRFSYTPHQNTKRVNRESCISCLSANDHSSVAGWGIIESVAILAAPIAGGLVTHRLVGGGVSGLNLLIGRGDTFDDFLLVLGPKAQ